MQRVVSCEARTNGPKTHKRRKDLPNLYLIFALYVIYLLLPMQIGVKMAYEIID